MTKNISREEAEAMTIDEFGFASEAMIDTTLKFVNRSGEASKGATGERLAFYVDKTFGQAASKETRIMAQNISLEEAEAIVIKGGATEEQVHTYIALMHDERDKNIATTPFGHTDSKDLDDVAAEVSGDPNAKAGNFFDATQLIEGGEVEVKVESAEDRVLRLINDLRGYTIAGAYSDGEGITVRFKDGVKHDLEIYLEDPRTILFL